MSKLNAVGRWLKQFIAPDYLRDPYEGQFPASTIESRYKQLNSGNPQGVDVDWTQAPLDAVEWRYSAKAGQGRWLNGKHRVEEYGVVWDWEPAPSFGANEESCVNIDPLGEALRQAAYQARSLQSQTPQLPARKTPPAPTRRL